MKNQEERLIALEVSHAQLRGEHSRLKMEHRAMAKCVAGFQETYGDSIKATAADRALLRQVRDDLIRRVAWTIVLFLIACLGAGALFFFRRWLGWSPA